LADDREGPDPAGVHQSFVDPLHTFIDCRMAADLGCGDRGWCLRVPLLLGGGFDDDRVESNFGLESFFVPVGPQRDGCDLPPLGPQRIGDPTPPQAAILGVGRSRAVLKSRGSGARGGRARRP
jgi:hypothetical protein